MSEPFTVTGSGFRPNEPITVQLVIGELASPIVEGAFGSQVTANGAGAFSVDFEFVSEKESVIEQAPGDRTLLATGPRGDGSTASTPVKIVRNPRSTSVSLASGVVEPAGDATFVGAGFAADEIVIIVAVGAGPNGVDVQLVGDKANSFGAFSLMATIDLAEGQYTVRAIGANGSEATAALVVVDKP